MLHDHIEVRSFFPVVIKSLDWIILRPGPTRPILTSSDTGDDVSDTRRIAVVGMNPHASLGLGKLLHAIVDLHVLVPIQDLVVGVLQDSPVLVS